MTMHARKIAVMKLTVLRITMTKKTTTWMITTTKVTTTKAMMTKIAIKKITMTKMTMTKMTMTKMAITKTIKNTVDRHKTGRVVSFLETVPNRPQRSIAVHLLGGTDFDPPEKKSLQHRLALRSLLS